MFNKALFTFSAIKNYLGFTLTLISIIGTLLLAWFKGTSIEMLLPSLLGIYVLGRTVDKGNAAWASSRDPQADTNELIKHMSDK